MVFGHCCDHGVLHAFRDQEAILERFRESALARSETAEKLLFNIGRIPVKQSRRLLLRAANGKSCRRAEKAVAARAL
jgi:hypothetical protein